MDFVIREGRALQRRRMDNTKDLSCVDEKITPAFVSEKRDKIK